MRYKHVLQSLALGLLLVFMAACKGDGGGPKPPDEPTPGPAVLDLDKGEVDLGQEASVTFKVKNTGGQELSWSVSNVADLKWLSLSAVSGKVAVGAEFEITISVDKSKLAPGQNQVQVNVTADPGGTKSLTVKAFLAQAPVLADLAEAQVKAKTANSVQIEGQVTNIGTANITQHGHIWSLKAGQVLGNDGVKSTKLGALSSPKTFTSSLTGLKSNTVYYIRTYATNSAGTKYSKDFGFKTGNNTPSAIRLSNSLIRENLPVGTVVGTLTTTDADSDDKHTYILVAGDGGADKDQFTIMGNELKAAVVFDYEKKKVYSIRVKSTDSNGGNHEQTFTINIENVVEGGAPTDIKLSENEFIENRPVGSMTITLTAEDPDAGDTHTFALASNQHDNDSFMITNNVLTNKVVLDFEARSDFAWRTARNAFRPRPVIYKVAIKATDKNGLSFTKVLDIIVHNENAEGIEMVDIKGGTYTFREGCQVTVTDFQISKYPITNAQFIEFLNGVKANSNGQGFSTIYRGTSLLIPFIYRSLFDPHRSGIKHDGTKFYHDKPNDPVIGVTYYGTEGFTNWAKNCRTCKFRRGGAAIAINSQLEYLFRLPNNGGVEDIGNLSLWTENLFWADRLAATGKYDPYPPCGRTNARPPNYIPGANGARTLLSRNERSFMYSGNGSRFVRLRLIVIK